MNDMVHGPDIQADHKGRMCLGLPVNEDDPQDVARFLEVAWMAMAVMMNHGGGLRLLEDQP